jgi:hypothetical protein
MKINGGITVGYLLQVDYKMDVLFGQAMVEGFADLAGTENRKECPVIR